LRISPKSDIENTWATILYNFSMATMSGQILYMANIIMFISLTQYIT
jgi:hypothetical protein